MGVYGLPGAWTSFTPNWTNLVPGNGTNLGKYVQFGKTVHFHTEFTLGTTSTVSATSTIFDFPVAPVTLPQFVAIGHVTLLTAASGTIYWGRATWNTAAQIRLTTDTIVTTTDRGADVTSTSPFTFATGAIIASQGTYEAA